MIKKYKFKTLGRNHVACGRYEVKPEEEIIHTATRGDVCKVRYAVYDDGELIYIGRTFEDAELQVMAIVDTWHSEDEEYMVEVDSMYADC